MKKIIYLYKKTRQYWPFAILTPIFMVAEAIIELLIPDRIASIIDYLKISSEINIKVLLVEHGLPLLLISLLSLICGFIGGVFAAIASSGFSSNLKKDLFNKVQTFSFENIDKYQTSSLITRMTTDCNYVQQSYQMSIRMLFRSPSLFIVAFIKAMRYSEKLSLIFLIAVPLIAIGLFVIFLLAHPYFEKGIKELDNLNSTVEENVRGIRTVKSFTREEKEIEKFKGVTSRVENFFEKGMKIVNMNGPVMNLAIYAVILLIAIIGTKLFGSTGDLSGTGKMYALFSYALQILTSLMFMSMILVMFVISKPSRERIYEIFMEEPTIKAPKDPIYEVKDGSIEFKNVSFKYHKSSEKPVLDNINLSIKSGETIGIIGATGSSKSTLIYLLPRLYDVDEGKILIGGNNIKYYDLVTLRKEVSIALQKNVLFSGTVEDNLRWGCENATKEELFEAMRIAQCESFVPATDEGLSMHMEQGGTNFSGGQRQRLCIARALLKNPKIIIFDDSMSAVDVKTDKLIRTGLKKLRPDMTKIIVAQRCVSVEDADRVIIMDEGKIVDFDTPANLMKTSEIYKEIYHIQNKEAKNE